MPISEAAHALLDAFDTHNLDALAAIFHDKLQVMTHEVAAMDKAAMLARQQAYFDAFSNWDYHFAQARQTADVMVVNYAVTGTHDGVLDLRPLGYDIQVEPANQSISLPQSTLTVTFDPYGLVIRMQLHQGKGWDLPGVLDQLGIKPPSVG